jgi:hypothetical protein
VPGARTEGVVTYYGGWWPDPHGYVKYVAVYVVAAFLILLVVVLAVAIASQVPGRGGRVADPRQSVRRGRGGRSSRAPRVRVISRPRSAFFPEAPARLGREPFASSPVRPGEYREVGRDPQRRENRRLTRPH